MSGITGRTSNKLFQVKTIDLSQPYQVGKRGVTAIDTVEDGNFRITYIIDGIKYLTFSPQNFSNINKNDKLSLSPEFGVGELVKFKKTTNKFNENTFEKKVKSTNKPLKFKPDLSKGKPQKLVKQYKISETLDINPAGVRNDSVLVTDTIYITDKKSYDTFINQKIYKEEKYVGLINKPIIESDVFMERDAGSLFERQQRLSEINNISDLANYRNGYFNLTNTF